MEKNFMYENLPVRVLTDENEQIWFAGIDVCNILGYADSHQKIKTLDEDEYRLDRVRDGQGKQKETLTVNEFGFYALVLGSTTPEAKLFKKWVCHQVLPVLRKAGKFTTDQQREYEVNLHTVVSELNELKASRDSLQKQLKKVRTDIETKTAEMVAIIRQDRQQLKIDFTAEK